MPLTPIVKGFEACTAEHSRPGLSQLYSVLPRGTGGGTDIVWETIAWRRHARHARTTRREERRAKTHTETEEREQGGSPPSDVKTNNTWAHTTHRGSQAKAAATVCFTGKEPINFYRSHAWLRRHQIFTKLPGWGRLLRACGFDTGRVSQTAPVLIVLNRWFGLQLIWRERSILRLVFVRMSKERAATQSNTW